MIGLSDNSGAGAVIAEPAPTTTGPALFDFRRPNKFSVAHVRSLEGLHESFARRFAGALTQALRCVVQFKPVSVDELTYENYVRSLPNPSVLVPLSLPPLPGIVVLEMSSPMGLLLVDRVLGGLGLAGNVRRPTDLENQLLGEIMKNSLGAFEETFAPVLEIAPEIGPMESNPHVVQAASPSETVLLLSYNVTLSGHSPHEGMVTVCYPFSMLQPVLDRLELHAKEQPIGQGDDADDRIAAHIAETVVSLTVRLSNSVVSAADVARLKPGDVLRLDHPVEAPALGVVQGKGLVEGYVGRTGKRLGFRMSGWRFGDE